MDGVDGAEIAEDRGEVEEELEGIRMQRNRAYIYRSFSVPALFHEREEEGERPVQQPNYSNISCSMISLRPRGLDVLLSQQEGRESGNYEPLYY